MQPLPVRRAPGLVLAGHERPVCNGVRALAGLLALSYLTQTLFKVVLQKFISPQICQLILL